MLAIRDGDYKFLMRPGWHPRALYDIPADPTQLTNIADRHPAIVEQLSQQLRK